MSWDFPLLWTAAAALPLIVIAHLLSRRRRTLVVPSLMLWERLIAGERRFWMLGRLLRENALVLQLIAAALLVLALTGPRLSGGAGGRGDAGGAGGAGRITGPAVLVIDVSAGMSALERGNRSRFDLAMDEARRLIRGKSPNAEVMLIAGGARPEAVSGFTGSRRALLEALNGITPRDEAGRPGAALRAARAAAAGRRGARVIFVTDGAYTLPPGESTAGGGWGVSGGGSERGSGAASEGGADGGSGGSSEGGTGGGSGGVSGAVSVLRVGEDRANSGITGFSIRAYRGGGRELLATVDHYGDSPRTAALSIRLNGRELVRENLDLRPGERTTRSVSWHEPLGGRIEARLIAERPDALAADDAVFAMLPPEERIRAALITPGNRFLEALLKNHPNIVTDVFYSLEEWEAEGGGWDMVVADRLAPEGLAASSLIAIYPFDSSGAPALPLRPLGSHSNLEPTGWNSAHPAIRGLDLSGVVVSAALEMETGPGVSVLAESRGIPLILAGEGDSGRWLALSFDLLKSSLPLRPAFPIFMAGAAAWLTPGEDIDEAGYFARAGESRGPGASEVPGRVGFHVLEGAGEGMEIGVNLLSSEESNLTVRLNWDDPGRGGVFAGEGGPSGRSREGGRSPRPLASVLMAAALGMMVLEWVMHGRGRWA